MGAPGELRLQDHVAGEPVPAGDGGIVLRVLDEGAASIIPESATWIEQQLLPIFASVLRRDDMGVTDGVFEVGGHSLLLTRVAARIRRELPLEVPLRTLFENASVRALASELDRSGARVSTREQGQLMSDLLDELERSPRRDYTHNR